MVYSQLKETMFTKSVDQVVAVFNKAITDLNKVEEKHMNAVQKKCEKTVQIQTEIAQHEQEIKRAFNIRAKLNAIIN